METVFLSYTYRSHPKYDAQLSRILRQAIRLIEAMGLRVIDGVDVGGRALDAALEQRISDADALIALMTPQANAAGDVIDPAFVLSEFQFARGLKKPTFRAIHEELSRKGLGAHEEYVAIVDGQEAEMLVKLANTIAIWKREHGRAARVRIDPGELARDYNETRGDRCEFQRIRDGQFDDFVRARVRLEPGAVYAELPKLREGDQVRMRMQVAGVQWDSKYVVSPFVGAVQLEKRP